MVVLNNELESERMMVTESDEFLVWICEMCGSRRLRPAAVLSPRCVGSWVSDPDPHVPRDDHWPVGMVLSGEVGEKNLSEPAGRREVPCVATDTGEDLSDRPRASERDYEGLGGDLRGLARHSGSVSVEALMGQVAIEQLMGPADRIRFGVPEPH
jgi:hypothetical protein